MKIPLVVLLALPFPLVHSPFQSPSSTKMALKQVRWALGVVWKAQ